MRILGSSLAFILASLTQLAAQEARLDFLRYTVTGEKFGDKLGQAMAGLGDVDGDKCPDFAVGVPQYCAEDDCRGKVVIYSGRTGTVIRSWGTEDPHWHYGQNLANGGDIDGDGVDDILASGPTFIEQRSGKTGALLGVIRDSAWNAWGIAIETIGDVDADGVPDFAVGNSRPEGSDAGRVSVFSGKAGRKLWENEAEAENTGFGSALAAVGDVDGDRVADVAVGSPGQAFQEEIPGKVEIFNGRDGVPISSWSLGLSADWFGTSIAAIGDIDRDGSTDLAVGSSGYPARGVRGAGRVDMYTAQTGKRLWSQFGQDFEDSSAVGGFGGDSFGAQVWAVGDADGDRIPDLAILSVRAGIGGMHWSRVSLCSGETGRIVALYETEKNETQFGWSLGSLGDINDDGRSEFLIGAPEYFEEDAPRPDGTWLFDLGRVYVVSYDPESPIFLRGDTDLDGDMDITDSIALLVYLYQGGTTGCEEGMDIDRNHRLNLTDAVIILLYLFQGGMAPQPPFPDCSRFEAFSSRLSCERSSCR